VQRRFAAPERFGTTARVVYRRYRGYGGCDNHSDILPAPFTRFVGSYGREKSVSLATPTRLSKSAEAR
jgi:hypothetical protein